MSGRLPVSFSFLAFGITVGGLIPRMPALKDHLHLTDGQVGIALLGVSVGGIIGALLSRFVIGRHGVLGIRAATFVLAVAGVGPALAPSLGLLVATLCAVGFLWGFIDVLGNGFGAHLERVAGRPMINGFHGFWSLGAFVGSVVAGGSALAGVTPLVQFVATGALIAAASVLLMRGFAQPAATDESPPAFGAVAMTSVLLGLAAMAFTGVIAEGGTSDWSALFLREISHASPGVAAGGFSAFTIAATAVRFRADLLTARIGTLKVVRLGAALAAGGLLLVILVPILPMAILGFALVGVGTAVLLPLVFAAGANLMRDGSALAIVMASTYAGTIAGPPLIGATADRFGLRLAMLIPLAAGLVVLGLSATGLPRSRTSGG